MAAKTDQRGAPIANLNASKNGTRISRLVIGELPQTMRRQTQNARRYRRQLEQAVKESFGEISLTAAHLIDEAVGAEVHAAVCRWLMRTKLTTMSVADITRCSEQILKSKSIRNRAVERLAIDRDKFADAIDVLYSRIEDKREDDTDDAA